MNFDWFAPHYVWLEPLLAGRVLQDARALVIGRLDGCKRVLILGDGPGQSLERVLRQWPDAQITTVDASGPMLAVARRRVRKIPGAASRITWVHAALPAPIPVPTDKFDAVITSCFLDCFDPVTLRRIISDVAEMCSPEAAWLLIDFALPAHGWRRVRAQIAHRLMYGFFHVFTGISARRWTDPGDDLRCAGFERLVRHDLQHGLVESAYWKRVAPDSALKAAARPLEMSA